MVRKQILDEESPEENLDEDDVEEFPVEEDTDKLEEEW